MTIRACTAIGAAVGRDRIAVVAASLWSGQIGILGWLVVWFIGIAVIAVLRSAMRT